jgi:proline dehydrogenase
MPNRLLLSLAKQEGLARFSMENPVLRPMVLRFVAGEHLSDAVEVVRGLNARGIQASLDHLGENTPDREGARAAAFAYVDSLRAIAAHSLDANISVKLTAIGLDIADSVAKENLRTVLDAAHAQGTFVRVDMEGSPYTGRTLELVEHMWAAGYDNVGPVIQAYLYRSAADVERLVRQDMRVRLVKGAYNEAPNIAFRRKRDTDRNYVRLMEVLLERGNYPAIATHDEAIIAHAQEFARARGIGRERFEFQMLYGVRRDLQDRLVAAGYNVRVYVPCGAQWYPYLIRRLAERPANLAFVLSAVARDSRRSPA